eukprot:TRINITY_DN4886_c0_g3_i1.p1 TRINITY_DN4886_c0_g3~~TRINITY_DN4886_c0_g3_i1.p1  ORF type:complete len:502 (+),score=151.58 TRINITY_DN4886_c0_g3_i1:303-1808(+)
MDPPAALPGGFVLIEHGRSCETNPDGVTRFEWRDRTKLAECAALCADSAKCEAFDWYQNSGWCNLYPKPCSTPQGAHDQPSSYRRSRPGERAALAAERRWELDEAGVLSCGGGLAAPWPAAYGARLGDPPNGTALVLVRDPGAALRLAAVPAGETPRGAPPQQPDRRQRVVVATYVHSGAYDRGFAGHQLGMLDNLAIMTHSFAEFNRRPQRSADYELLALLTNSSAGLEPFFARLGWLVRRAHLRVQPGEVRNPQIAREVVSDGAIGIFELVKLELWRPQVLDRPEADAVLLIDTDIFFQRPPDAIFSPAAFPPDATLAFTQGEWPIEKVNGGFLAVRVGERSERDLDEMHDTLREGDFRSGSGWKGTGYGWTYGGRTVQGLLPYHYLAGPGRGRAVRLPRCIFNNMVNSDACRAAPPKAVVSNHFTGGCPKPWTCFSPGHALCAHFTAEWWAARARAAAALGLAAPPRCPERGRYQPIPFGDDADWAKVLPRGAAAAAR